MKRVLLLFVAVSLAACTSSGTRAKSSAPTHSPSSIAAATVAPSVLTTKLASLSSVTSVQVAASTDVSGQKIVGTGTARLADGAIVAGDLTQALPGGLGDIRVIRVGGQTYAKLPAALTKTAKPWLVLTSTSSNPVVSQLSGVVDTILAVASPSSLVAFANAATSIRDLGGGHYTLKVEAAKLPSALSSALGGTGAIPVDVYLDAQNRPTKVSGTFTLAGAPITPTITLSGFNQTVSIVAPPASQVGSK